MTLQPLNGHIQIQPIEQDSFISSSKTAYEEMGTVISVADGVTMVNIGDRVYFDSYLCDKYPTGNKDEFYWLVPSENLRARSYED